MVNRNRKTIKDRGNKTIKECLRLQEENFKAPIELAHQSSPAEVSRKPSNRSIKLRLSAPDLELAMKSVVSEIKAFLLHPTDTLFLSEDVFITGDYIEHFAQDRWHSYPRMQVWVAAVEVPPNWNIEYGNNRQLALLVQLREPPKVIISYNVVTYST